MTLPDTILSSQDRDVTSLDSLRHSDFAGCIGTAFAIPSLDPHFSLVLEGANLLGHHHPTAIRDAFSVMFRGPVNCRLPQGIYQLEHATLGSLEIFLTQVSGDPKGSEFEAIFT